MNTPARYVTYDRMLRVPLFFVFSGFLLVATGVLLPELTVSSLGAMYSLIGLCLFLYRRMVGFYVTPDAADLEEVRAKDPPQKFATNSISITSELAYYLTGVPEKAEKYKQWFQWLMPFMVRQHTEAIDLFIHEMERMKDTMAPALQNPEGKLSAKDVSELMDNIIKGAENLREKHRVSQDPDYAKELEKLRGS